MTDTGKKLMSMLKTIYDDHDFICGTMSNCGGDLAWGNLYDIIVYAKEHDEVLTSDDILALSLTLGEEMSVKNKLVCSA